MSSRAEGGGQVWRESMREQGQKRVRRIVSVTQDNYGTRPG